MSSLTWCSLLLLSTSSSGSENNVLPRCVSGFCLPADYERLELPLRPTVVHISVDVMDITAVDDDDFTVSIYSHMLLRWAEPRLYSDRDNATMPLVNAVDTLFKDVMWIPNPLIFNIKSVERVKGVRDESTLFILNKRGKSFFEVMYIILAEISFLCPMRFDSYPLDAHKCPLRFYSARSTSAIQFAPAKFNYDPRRRSIVLEFHADISELPPHNIRVHEGDRVRNLSSTGIELLLTRNKLKYIPLYYLPSGLFVVVSWVSFLIPPEIVAGRMALLITLFLVLINIFSIVNSNMPNAEGITAITAWMISCIFCVFCALMCYAYLLWRLRPSILKRRSRRSRRQGVFADEPKGKKARLAKVDDACIVVFPVVFVLFNVVYWSLCLRGTPSQPEFLGIFEGKELLF